MSHFVTFLLASLVTISASAEILNPDLDHANKTVSWNSVAANVTTTVEQNLLMLAASTNNSAELSLRCLTQKIDGEKPKNNVFWYAEVNQSKKEVVWWAPIGTLRLEFTIPVAFNERTISGTLEECKNSSCDSDLLTIDRYNGKFMYHNRSGVSYTGECRAVSNKKLF